jgi:hypothetical protein
MLLNAENKYSVVTLCTRLRGSCIRWTYAFPLSYLPSTFRSRYYITASSSKHHRVLKIDRTSTDSLAVTEDHAIYDAAQLQVLLRMVDDGNKGAGGLEKVHDFQ